MSDREIEREQARAEEALDRFQQLERRVAELEARLEALEQVPVDPPSEKP